MCLGRPPDGGTALGKWFTIGIIIHLNDQFDVSVSPTFPTLRIADIQESCRRLNRCGFTAGKR